MRSFFQIDDEIFQKNSATTALHVTNPMLGERYIFEAQAKRIKPYVPPAGAAPVQAPRDPEVFETRENERKPSDANFGATDIKVTSADTSVVEQGIQPPPETGKRPKPVEAPEIEAPVLDMTHPLVQEIIHNPPDIVDPPPPPEARKHHKKEKKHPDRDITADEDFGTPHVPKSVPEED